MFLILLILRILWENEGTDLHHMPGLSTCRLDKVNLYRRPHIETAKSMYKADDKTTKLVLWLGYGNLSCVTLYVYGV